MEGVLGRACRCHWWPCLHSDDLFCGAWREGRLVGRVVDVLVEVWTLLVSVGVSVWWERWRRGCRARFRGTRSIALTLS